MIPENMDEKRINPQIAEVEVGIQYLRKISIYPLSLYHEKNLSKKIATFLGTFSEASVEGAAGAMSIGVFAADFIMENIEEILSYAAPEENAQTLMQEITSDQAVEIAKIIYEINYETIIKKVLELLSRMKPKAQEEATTTV